jgi:O-antigen/teichoic acid export membrane protein
MRSNFSFKPAFLSFRSLDDGTPEGASRERYRLAALGSLANFLSSLLGLLTLVVTVPLTLSYLGEERFGVWMTIGSLATLLSFLDLGIGNGLINRVARAKAEAAQPDLPSVISHGLLVLLAVGGTVGVLLFCLVQYLPIARLIKVTDPALIGEAETSILTFCVIFAASIPLGGLQKIFQGLQLAWIAHLVKALSALLSLLLVYFSAQQKAGIPVLLLATFGIQTFVFFALLYPLVREKKLCLPRFSAGELTQETKSLLNTGGLFLFLQIGYLVGWGSDPMIISSVLGAGEVTKLALVQRLFQFVLLPLSIINAPMWAAYADANARGDRDFISHALKRTLVRTAALAAVGCVGMIFLSPFIFRAWLRGNVEIPADLVMTYGLWIFIQCVFIPVSMLLNGLGVVKAQAMVVLAFCIVCLPLKFLLIQHIGVVGVIQAAIIAYLLTAAIPYVVLLARKPLRDHLTAS